MRFLRWLNYSLYKIQRVTVVGIFLIMLLLAFLQVVLRLFFKGGIEGADVLVRYLVLWIGFLGASLATYKHRHINIDVFGSFFRESNKRVARVIVNFAALIVVIFLIKASVTYIGNEMSDTKKIMYIPLWIMELVLPLSFTFMGLKFLQDGIEGIIGKKRGGVKMLIDRDEPKIDGAEK